MGKYDVGNSSKMEHFGCELGVSDARSTCFLRPASMLLSCNILFMELKPEPRYSHLPMQPATLDIEQQPSAAGVLVARLRGKVSLETVNGFLQQLRAIEAQKLVLDMSGVSFLDSAGVGALVQLFV